MLLRGARSGLAAILISIAASLVQTSFGNLAPSLVVEEIVETDGTAVVSILFSADVSSQEGLVWLTVPSDRSSARYKVETFGTAKTKLLPAYVSRETDEPYYFYDNFTISYTGKVSARISYNFSRASLVYEPEAFFVSPLILFGGVSNSKFVLTLKGASGVSEVSPAQNLAGRRITDDGASLVFSIPTSDGRINVHYSVRGKIQLDEIVVGKFTGYTPRRYAEIMKNILHVYSRVYPELAKFFNSELGDIKVRFFVPNPRQVEVEGFVPITRTGLGDVHMNLFYIRTAEGFFEQGSLHELIHHFLWASGLKPEVLWFHEGAANFFSVNVLSTVDYPGADLFQQDILRDAETLGTNLGFLQDWSYSSSPGDTTLYYAGAYKVLHILNQTYGPTLFVNFFTLLNRTKQEVSGTQQVVQYLSAAAREDLSELFRGLGFRVSSVNLEELTPKFYDSEEPRASFVEYRSLDLVQIVLVVAIAFASIVLLVFFSRHRVKLAGKNSKVVYVLGP